MAGQRAYKGKVWDIISSNLKPLNKKAEAIFKKIIDGVKADAVKRIGEPGKAIMQVIIEEIYHENEYGKVYSLGHYYQQMGDRMSDPEMTFLVNKTDKRVYPLTFEQHGTFARYETNCSFENGKLKSICKRMINDHKNFANIWMENISHQQTL